MQFTIFQESRIGRRKSNQDRVAYCYSRDALLMLVADGMGGHLHGEIAAHLAVQSIAGAFQSEAHPALQDPAQFLPQALLAAHGEIVDYSLIKDMDETPRTTIVAGVVQDGYLYWAHAGDSRLYLLRQGEVIAQTRDHSRVQLMMDQGLLDAESAARHPGRNRVYSCLGGNRSPHIELSDRIRLRDGDVVLLCTDGLWGPLGTEDIAAALTAGNLMDIIPSLMTRAEALSGVVCDNLSIVAMRWNLKEDTGPDSISTHEMTPDGFTSHMSLSQPAAQPDNEDKDEGEFTEDDIERAIEELNAAIRKFKQP